MADIIVARLQFPNDPTNNNVAHQMFIAEQTEQYLNLYSVSSILGKERRVYGSEKDHYITILAPEYSANNFKVPSFIDCTKMYQVQISSNTNLAGLAQRRISPELRERIDEKIAEMKANGLHTTYSVSEADFGKWNPRTQNINK